MRKIENLMIQAIKDKTNFSLSNTTVSTKPDIFGDVFSEVMLHGNHIATFDHQKQSVVVNVDTLRLWPTNTTKSRLRALGVDVYQKSGRIYLDGIAI